MSIERRNGEVKFICDVGNCPKEFTLHDDSFDLTWNAAKREGWEVKKIAGEWLHACPDCML